AGDREGHGGTADRVLSWIFHANDVEPEQIPTELDGSRDGHLHGDLQGHPRENVLFLRPAHREPFGSRRLDGHKVHPRPYGAMRQAMQGECGAAAAIRIEHEGATGRTDLETIHQLGFGAGSAVISPAK